MRGHDGHHSDLLLRLSLMMSNAVPAGNLNPDIGVWPCRTLRSGWCRLTQTLVARHVTLSGILKPSSTRPGDRSQLHRCASDVSILAALLPCCHPSKASLCEAGWSSTCLWRRTCPCPRTCTWCAWSGTSSRSKRCVYQLRLLLASWAQTRTLPLRSACGQPSSGGHATPTLALCRVPA